MTIDPTTNSFIDAVKRGPEWSTGKGVCQSALVTFSGWRERELDFPPYISYLILFVLAADFEGNYSPNAYYPRLRELLNEPGEGTLPSFDKMWMLWEDLEHWSQDDKDYELGIFKANSIGRRIHVGYPLGQIILNEQEREQLPRIFEENRLDPSSIPPAEELSRALRSSIAQKIFRKMVFKRICNPKTEPELYIALLEAISKELLNWNGESFSSKDIVDGTNRTSVRFRICLKIDRVSRSVNTYLRFRLNKEFPDEGLIISDVFSDDLIATESHDGWSLPVGFKNSGKPANASVLDWVTGLDTSTEDWSFHLPERRVRIFVDGASMGLSGFIEDGSLPKGKSFYIAYHKDASSKVERWGTSQCHNFEELNINSGLPQDWKLAKIGEALDDNNIKSYYSWISFPSSIRICLMGGIRSKRGNNFFNFAPPLSISVEGNTKQTSLTCDKFDLPRTKLENVYQFPKRVSAETRITIELHTETEVLTRTSLFCTGDYSIPQLKNKYHFDHFGKIARTDTQVFSIAGANYRTDELPHLLSDESELFEFIKYEAVNTNCILIGRFLGQLFECPSVSLPTSWLPVWMLKKHKRKWEAVFLRNTIHNSSPSSKRSGSSHEIKRWKELVWRNRKQYMPQKLVPLQSLWKDYLEVARNA